MALSAATAAACGASAGCSSTSALSAADHRQAPQRSRTAPGPRPDRPRDADGRFLETPTDDFDVDKFAQLETKTGITFLLVGAAQSWSERGQVGVAAGAGHADASFRSVYSPVPFLGAARYYEQIDRVAFVAQARADGHLGRGWHAGVTVRYTDFEGVQITSPLFEPDFGNTKVRLWSLLPRVSLVF
jgi:hypothetical protein